MSGRTILVTSALPYANGHLHLGHLVEHVQTDVWARFQRLRGNRCVALCADDTHGTATMIRARREGRSEEAVIAEMNAAHQRDLAAFGVQYAHYSSTNSAANRALCHRVWAALRAAGMVASRDVEQLYDPQEGIFLADRFVRGTCPRCRTPNQHGDSCDACGATYTAAEVLDPVSAHTGATPQRRSHVHLFVEIERLRDFLTTWTQEGDHLQPEIANFLRANFLGEPLRDWDISRPAPYFGFEIPDAPGNYWYVWFDAPLGYVATTQEWCEREGERIEDWWSPGGAEIRHFIGKDIVYFHTLFWPAMLKTAGLALPRRIQVHGFLTVGGGKMSKSKGTFVRASTYAEHLDPSYLRYFFASKLGGGLDDVDLDVDELAAKVNSDLVGKVVNLASRTARFVKGTGLAGTWPSDEGLFAQGVEDARRVADLYERCDYARAMRMVMAQADRANAFVERTEPWRLQKQPGRGKDVQDACTVALNLFRQVATCLAPVLPRLADQAGDLLGRPITRWDDLERPLLGGAVAPFVPMLQRLDPVAARAMFDASVEPA